MKQKKKRGAGLRGSLPGPGGRLDYGDLAGKRRGFQQHFGEHGTCAQMRGLDRMEGPRLDGDRHQGAGGARGAAGDRAAVAISAGDGIGRAAAKLPCGWRD